MRQLSLTILTACLLGIVLWSCTKYKDPDPKDDPRLTNPYCNDPAAVNYNRGFPGKPDNTVCYYASDIFQGQYMVYDSVYRPSTDSLFSGNLFIGADSFLVTIAKTTATKIALNGWCTGGNALSLTANKSYVATVDTTVGDSLTLNPGQLFCRIADTVSGTLKKDKIDTTLLYVNLQILSDTGVSYHIGRARKR